MSITINNATINGSSYFVPFMAWNRLEVRTRKTNYENALKAKVYDPLWMLGKQWQMGEFQGEDSGSGILAKAMLEFSKTEAISHIDGSNLISVANEPTEPIVERVDYKFSLKEKVLLWKKWCSFISLTQGLSLSDFNLLLGNLKVLFTDPTFSENTTADPFIISVDAPVSTSSESQKIEASNLFCDNKTRLFIESIASTTDNINGHRIFRKFISSGITTFATDVINALTSPQISISDLENASTNFINWVQQTYMLSSSTNNYWNKSKLEYQFETHTSNGERLVSNEYHDGKLDWYSVEESVSGTATSPNTTIAKEMIMTEGQFAGMPSSRWWEFENGKVNFCKLDASTTDIAKIILTQFTLIYQDDWFLIPYKIPVGTYSSMKGIVITDVFGVKTLVMDHHYECDNSNPSLPVFNYITNSWKDWSWMDITKKSEVVNKMQPSGQLYFPNTVTKVQSSKPIEKVMFVRDEMSNLVWGIEEIVPNNMGCGVNGLKFSTQYLNYLSGLVPASAINPSTLFSDVKLKYQLMNSVPENWIPFIAKYNGSALASTRDVVLQRATMPRILEGFPTTTLVRPRTSILNPDDDFGSPYFIDEEEISRAGTIVETTFQRARWFDGKTYLWVGRQKTIGRGQGNSGLVFDTLKDVE